MRAIFRGLNRNFSHTRMGGLCLILLMTGAGSSGWGAEARPTSYTYADLVKRLTDLEYLATLPDPGEQV
jgi:hypothetical protein